MVRIGQCYAGVKLLVQYRNLLVEFSYFSVHPPPPPPPPHTHQDHSDFTFVDILEKVDLELMRNIHRDTGNQTLQRSNFDENGSHLELYNSKCFCST